MRILRLKLSSNFKYLDTFLEFGRGRAMVLEPDPFSIKREYRIEWVKQLPIAELAHMRWGQGLAYKEISRRTGIP